MINQVLENTFNHLLHSDPHSQSRLATLAGKSVGIELVNTPVQWLILLCAEGIEVNMGQADNADCILRGTPIALMRYLNVKQINPSTNKSLGIEIEGDLEFAREFSAILRQLDIDWEEIFSPFIGDFPARQLSSIFANLRSDFKRSADSGKQHLKYLVSERLDQIVTQNEAEQFYNEIDTLSLRTDRLEQKMNLLKPTKENA